MPPLIAVRSDRGSESAKWFRPSDVCMGPQGSIFIADWYDPGVGGHAMGDEQCRGRILRVVTRPVECRMEETFPGTIFTERIRWLGDQSFTDAREELLELGRRYDGTDRMRAYLEAFGLACEGKEDEIYALLAKELGDVPSKWTNPFAGLAWRLHPPSAVPAFAERAMDPSLPKEARKQSIDALAFVKTREAAEAMANLAAASPEDLRPYARWWLENRATNDWSGWVDRSALGGTLGDAELAWKSGVVRSGKFDIDLDVSGAKKLWLVVSEGEHGIDYDWADWLAPRFESGKKTTKLLDLDWLEAKSGWGTTNEGKNCEGGPLVVDGKTFTDGLGTHARSEIAYAVPAGTERFRATTAPDDMGSKRAGSTNELEFQVWLERKPARARLAPWTAALRAPDAA